MRRIAGAVLALLGLCAVLLGAGMAIWLGTDNAATTGPHSIETDTAAVATDHNAIGWAGGTVRVTAEVPDERPVFIGLGDAVDVNDYLADTATLRVDQYRVPWTLNTSMQSGQGWLPTTPLAIDWWRTRSAGEGGASIEFELPEDSASLAVLAIGDNDLSGLTITAAYTVPGGFWIGLGLIAVGLGVIVGSILVVRDGDQVPVVDEEGYVYVYYDDEGNEYLVPLDELDGYDIVDVTGERR